MISRKNNQKGFTLVELLIVIAIIGVLAVIAFNTFTGVLQNSKKRADGAQAKTIEKAIRILVAETGIPNIVDNHKRFKFKDQDDDNSAWGEGTNHDAVRQVIIGLQQIIYVQDYATGKAETFGPYLQSKDTNATANFATFAPQWNPGAGGKYVGYHIRIWTDTQNVLVEPAEMAADETYSSDPDDAKAPTYTNSKIDINP